MFRPTLDLSQDQHIPTRKDFFECEVTQFIKTQNKLLQKNFRFGEKFLRAHPFQSVFQQKKLTKLVAQLFYT